MENHYTKLIPLGFEGEDFYIARFLSEEEQKRYEESIKQFSGNAYDSLNVPRKGSNIWKVLQLNQIGIRTATLPELDFVIDRGMLLRTKEDQYGRIEVRGNYANGREILLRSNKDSYEHHDYLAKTLADKLKLTSFKHPYIIKGLGIKQSEASKEINPYGLEFVTDNAEVIKAPDFDHINFLERFKRINKYYSIEWHKLKPKIFYSSNHGLLYLSFNGNLVMGVGSDYFADSCDWGRVVVISAAEDRKARAEKEAHAIMQ